MSTESLIRGFCASVAALGVAWVIFDRSWTEAGELPDSLPSQRYMPYIANSLLPVTVGVFLLVGIFTGNPLLALDVILPACFGIFLHISAYYLLLMLALPLFRKYISARACATLWLLPNYLYFTLNSAMKPDKPAWIVPVSRTFLIIALAVWLTGFFAILAWKSLSHLVFRRKLLKNAIPVTDPDILELWLQEQHAAGYPKAPYKLFLSPTAVTPLSIGFLKRTIRVILPQKDYTLSDLGLIFRHEIVHIGREDSGTKFFLTFCTAMCWFNPLMWIAMRRSADDLELSCDETVLLEADEETRRRYAHLLLETAGNERGFTTCLSASARALRYRLQNIVKPRKRFSGAISVALVFFLLIISCGFFSLAYPSGTGADLIFDGQDPGQCTIQNINYTAAGQRVYATCTDPEKLLTYLASLDFYSLTGNYTFSSDEHQILLILQGAKGAFGVQLTDHTIKVTPLYGDSPQKTGFYMQSPLDWTYVASFLVTNPG